MTVDAATLLALAGVRAGETVVALGADGLLARSAAAAAGAEGRLAGPDAADATVDRVIDGRLDPDPPLAAYARLLRAGGRLVLAAPGDPRAALAAAGFDVVHVTAGPIHYVAATRRLASDP